MNTEERFKEAAAGMDELKARIEEANKALKFDREAAFGLRLDIPAGSAIRFEPGEEKEVALTTYAGEGNLYGFLGWTMGNIHDPKVKEKAIAAMKAELEGGE